MSLLPLARFGCERLLAVGDPKQLPPTLASTSSLHDEAVVGTAQDETLSKALFVRLSTYFEPILLRTQYRCHPELTCVPNALFYQGKLIDGVDPSERAPLVAGLPPLVFCNVVSGREQRQQDDVSGTSVFNETEVHFHFLLYSQWRRCKLFSVTVGCCCVQAGSHSDCHCRSTVVAWCSSPTDRSYCYVLSSVQKTSRIS